MNQNSPPNVHLDTSLVQEYKKGEQVTQFISSKKFYQNHEAMAEATVVVKELEKANSWS
jgi:hypothetical protein